MHPDWVAQRANARSAFVRKTFNTPATAIETRRKAPTDFKDEFHV